MTVFKRKLTISFLVLSLLACSGDRDNKTPIITNNWCISGGIIYTANDAQPQTSAIAVNDGRISYVAGETQEQNWCDKYAGRHPRNLMLDGKTLYPGFTDAHAHLIGIGLREMTLNLDQVESIAELKDIVAAEVAKTPAGQTVYGRGWIETHWPEGRFPTRYDLDEISPDNPVILERADGHAIVVNSLTLKMSGVTPNTNAPFGGEIRRGPNGKPDGMLVDNAQALVAAMIPSLTPDRRRKAYIRGSEVYAQRGWTNVHSMSVDPDDVDLINTLADEGKIKIRIYNSIDLLAGRDMPKADAEMADTENLITTRAIKLYADGALGSRGAALLAPYSDEPGNSGLMTLTRETALPILTAALRHGTQVNTHAIGDKANRQVLAWYKEAFEAVPENERPRPDHRWRIEHSQILNTDDINSFVALGVIPSMQPSHAIGDLHFAIDRLGKERLKGGYAWKSLIESGSKIAGGSDAPVEVGDPRIEFYAAMVRKDLKGYSNESWYPEEKVSPQDALKMFTTWAAYAAFEEDKLGTIEVGKAADFTILERDILTAEPQDILTSTVEMTIVKGEVAYEKTEAITP